MQTRVDGENHRTVSIERRARLSYDEFAQTYLYSNKPVVVTDAICGWKAVSCWTPEFFKDAFGEMKFTIAIKSRDSQITTGTTRWSIR